MRISSINLSQDSSERNDWYLIEVIAFILRYLKDELLTCLSKGGISLTTKDFHWVITVPAIWQEKGKQMMREAGYLVHITYNSVLFIFIL